MRLKVRSESFAGEFAKAASSILSKTVPYRVWTTFDERGPWYNVKVTSLMLFEFLDLDFVKLEPMVGRFPKGFLRGFFTAEGNPTFSVSMVRNGICLDASVVCSNNNQELLEFVSRLCCELGFNPGRIRLNGMAGSRTNLGMRRESGWLLSLTRFLDVKKFAQEIGFADTEKQAKLQDGLEVLERDGRFDGAVSWTNAYAKIGRKWMKKPLSASTVAEL